MKFARRWQQQRRPQQLQQMIGFSAVPAARRGGLLPFHTPMAAIQYRGAAVQQACAIGVALREPFGST